MKSNILKRCPRCGKIFHKAFGDCPTCSATESGKSRIEIDEPDRATLVGTGLDKDGDNLVKTTIESTAEPKAFAPFDDGGIILATENIYQAIKLICVKSLRSLGKLFGHEYNKRKSGENFGAWKTFGISIILIAIMLEMWYFSEFEVMPSRTTGGDPEAQFALAIECDNIASKMPVAVTGVKITSQKIGNNLTLIETIEPSNATNKNVTWSSDNTSVATVSTSGVVIGISGGTALINV
jgi:hypothetical protein